MNTFTREDFEHAARAAGIPGGWNEQQKCFWIADDLRGVTSRVRAAQEKLGLAHGRIWWSPPDDDGDSARLAAKLRLQVDHLPGGEVFVGYGPVRAGQFNQREHEVSERAADQYQAARHAIFRAAISIGKAMLAKGG